MAASASSELAEFYVKFGMRGSGELDSAIEKKRRKLEEAAGAFGRFAAKGMAAYRHVAAWADVAARRAAFVGAAVGAVAFQGMQGTQEAERMAGAWGLVSRVVATLLLPVIRAVTQAVIELVTWWVKLDAETRDQIQTWVLWGAAALAAAAALPIILKGVGFIATAVGLLKNKWLGVPVAIAAVGFAIEELSKRSGLLVDEMGEKIGILTAAWRGWAGIIGGVGNVLKGGSFDEGFKHFSGITDRLKSLEGAGLTDFAKKVMRDKLNSRLPGMKGGPGQPGGGVGVPVKIGEKSPEDEANDWWGNIMAAFKDRGPLHTQVKVEISGLQESWNKMQTMQQQTDPSLARLEKIMHLIEQGLEIMRKKPKAPAPVGP